MFLFNYGTDFYAARVGFTGSRPLIYAVYIYNENDEPLPSIPGQTYRSITKDQFEWIRKHLECDVSFISGDYPDRIGNLECRTHRVYYQLFEPGPVDVDIWEERQV